MFRLTRRAQKLLSLVETILLALVGGKSRSSRQLSLCSIRVADPEQSVGSVESGVAVGGRTRGGKGEGARRDNCLSGNFRETVAANWPVRERWRDVWSVIRVFLFDTANGGVKRLTKRMTSRRNGWWLRVCRSEHEFPPSLRPASSSELRFPVHHAPAPPDQRGKGGQIETRLTANVLPRDLREPPLFPLAFSRHAPR